MTYNGVAAFTDTAPSIVSSVKTSGTAGGKHDLFSGSTEIPNSIGKIQIDANFSNKTASGKIDNMRKVNSTTLIGGAAAFKTGRTMTGEIQIKNGVISQNNLNATFVGELNTGGTSEIYQGKLEGIFVGNRGEGLFGDFDTGTLGGGAANSLKGRFLVDTN